MILEASEAETKTLVSFEYDGEVDFHEKLVAIQALGHKAQGDSANSLARYKAAYLAARVSVLPHYLVNKKPADEKMDDEPERAPARADLIQTPQLEVADIELSLLAQALRGFIKDTPVDMTAANQGGDYFRGAVRAIQGNMAEFMLKALSEYKPGLIVSEAVSKVGFGN